MMNQTKEDRPLRYGRWLFFIDDDAMMMKKKKRKAIEIAGFG